MITLKAHATSADAQMLPPTYAGSSTVCDLSANGNQVLIFNGTAPPGQSAINCNTRFTADPYNGAVAITSTIGVTALTLNGSAVIPSIDGNTSIAGDVDIAGAVAISGNTKITGSIGSVGFDPVIGLPGGWGGGLHTWDVYSEGTIGVGTGGIVAAYMKNSGEIAGNFIYLGGVGPLNGASADNLLALQAAIGCGPFEALQKHVISGVTSFSCAAFTNLKNTFGTPIGVATVPNCSGKYLTSSSMGSLSCVAPPTMPPSLTAACPGGQVLQSITSGTPNCVTAPPAIPTCAAGQMVTANGTSFSCASVPIPLDVVRAKDTGNVVGMATYNSFIKLGVDINFPPAIYPADNANVYNQCKWTGNADPPTSNGTQYLNTVHSACLANLCEGMFGDGVQLYSLTGECSPSSTSPYCLSAFSGLPAVRASCFY